MAPRRQQSNSKPAAYRFIFDPEHVETLSGRVRAACTPCRRRKCKCSGGIPCQPCVSRGIECDGPVIRRNTRPKSPSTQDTFGSPPSQFEYENYPYDTPSAPTSSFSSPTSSNDFMSPVQTETSLPVQSSSKQSSWMEKAAPFDLAVGLGALEGAVIVQQPASGIDTDTAVPLTLTSLDIMPPASTSGLDFGNALHTSCDACSPSAANLECLARNLERQALVLRTLANGRQSCSREISWSPSNEWKFQDPSPYVLLEKRAGGECLDVTSPWNGRHDSIGQDVMGTTLSEIQTL